jgi:hypothetical protein
MADAAPSTAADAAAPVELAKVSCELATRSLASQEATLTEMQGRTGTLLAAGALAASFLGGRALDKVGLDFANWCALVAFGSSLVCAGLILLPGKAMTFSGSGREFYENAFEDGEAEIYRRLTYWLEGLHDANYIPMRRLARLFTGALCALGIAITLWAVAIATASAS